MLASKHWNLSAVRATFISQTAVLRQINILKTRSCLNHKPLLWILWEKNVSIIQKKCTLIIQWWNALILLQSYFLIIHQHVTGAILDATKKRFIKDELQGQNWITFYVLRQHHFGTHAQIELVNTEQIANSSGLFLLGSFVCPLIHCVNTTHGKK